MNKKARRMAALLAATAAYQAEPDWVLDPSCMTRIPDCHSLIEVLRHIKHGGPEWRNRTVTLVFSSPSNAWVRLYPIHDTDTPYFDFMYTREEPPRQVLCDVLRQYPQCAFLDWSPGRLACIEAQGADVELLADIIRDVAEVAWGECGTAVVAWYQEMGRA